MFVIAEGEDAGAKLRERPVLGKCKTAHFLRRFFFAGGLDLAPVVLGIPLAVGPMLHLVSSLCLHHVPPMFRARGGDKSFLATNGRYASTILNFLAAGLPLFNLGPRRSAKAPCPPPHFCSPDCLPIASHPPPFPCGGPACAGFAPRRAPRRRKPGRLRPRHRSKVLQSRQAGSGPHRFRLLQPRHPILPRPLDPARTEVVATAFLHFPR